MYDRRMATVREMGRAGLTIEDTALLLGVPARELLHGGVFYAEYKAGQLEGRMESTRMVRQAAQDGQAWAVKLWYQSSHGCGPGAGAGSARGTKVLLSDGKPIGLPLSDESLRLLATGVVGDVDISAIAAMRSQVRGALTMESRGTVLERWVRSGTGQGADEPKGARGGEPAGVPDDIQTAPGPLTDEDRRVLRQMGFALVDGRWYEGV